MSSTHLLIAAGILAVAIAYAGSHQTRGEMLVTTSERTGDVYGVFQLKDGRVRYCQSAAETTLVACSEWSAD